MEKHLIFILLLFPLCSFADDFAKKLATAALERTTKDITYDGAYFAMAYPNGDVPEHIGVCTDVVIRSYRAMGADLQVLVHEDMRQNFSAYPSKRIWGLSSTDRNIDHRRVPNLQTFFSRHGVELPQSPRKEDYRRGDIVTWMLPGNLPHIGIIADQQSPSTGNPLVIHNIGAGPVINDMLFAYPITGHYRYTPP